MTSDTVIDLGDGERIAFGDLPKFIGIAGTVLSADSGAGQNANRVTLFVLPAKGTTPTGTKTY